MSIVAKQSPISAAAELLLRCGTRCKLAAPLFLLGEVSFLDGAKNENYKYETRNAEMHLLMQNSKDTQEFKQ